MGTLASKAEIDVLIPSTGNASAGVWGYDPQKIFLACICKILQPSAFWPENGLQCHP